MVSTFSPGPLLGQTFPLADGVRVRLRLAHFSDRSAIADLLGRHSLDGARDDGEADRLVRFDPRRRYVLCACALIKSTERLVGVGAIDLRAEPVEDPDLMVIDPEVWAGRQAEALTELLWGALVGAARSVAQGRAA